MNVRSSCGTVLALLCLHGGLSAQTLERRIGEVREGTVRRQLPDPPARRGLKTANN